MLVLVSIVLVPKFKKYNNLYKHWIRSNIKCSSPNTADGCSNNIFIE